MSPDIFAIKNLLKEDKIWNAAKHHMENYHNTQNIETMVFSPTAYTVGQQRPNATEALASPHCAPIGPRKRKSSEPPAISGNKTGRGKRNGAV